MAHPNRLLPADLAHPGAVSERNGGQTKMPHTRLLSGLECSPSACVMGHLLLWGGGCPPGSLQHPFHRCMGRRRQGCWWSSLLQVRGHLQLQEQRVRMRLPWEPQREARGPHTPSRCGQLRDTRRPGGCMVPATQPRRRDREEKLGRCRGTWKMGS